MRPLTILILLAIPSIASAEVRQLDAGVAEYVIDGPSPVWDLPVGDLAVVRMPERVTGAGISDLKKKHGTPWKITMAGDTVMVRPGPNANHVLLGIQTDRRWVEMRLVVADVPEAAVRYAVVVEEPRWATWVDRDGLEHERRRAAAAAATSPLLAATILRSEGPVVVGSATGRWLRDDLVASLHVRNESSAPVEVQEWRLRVGGRPVEPIVLEAPSLAPGERGRVVLVLPDVARILGPLDVTAWNGGVVVGQATTSDWVREEQELVARSLVEELEERRLDHEGRHRRELAAYGLVGAVMLDGMEGAEMGRGVGLRYAKGFNRWWSWEADAAVVDCENATLGRFLMGGRAQWGHEGWVPVLHVGLGFVGGRAMGELRATMAAALRASVERELFGGLMLAVGVQGNASVSLGESVEAGVQLGARWK